MNFLFFFGFYIVLDKYLSTFGNKCQIGNLDPLWKKNWPQSCKKIEKMTFLKLGCIAIGKCKI